MKKALLTACFVLLAIAMQAQKPTKAIESVKAVPVATETKLYNEEADAIQQIDEALAEAQRTGRYVLCQVGGNWCPWCLRFAKFVTEDEEIAQLIKENFVYIHVNYSKENKNPEAMQRLGNPARFGFPVLVILDHEGRPMHIQNSAYLELDKSYDRKKVLQFLQNWTQKAVETLK